jgi:hypothetical protein
MFITVREMAPSASNSRRWAVSMRWVTPGMRRRITLNRAGPWFRWYRISAFQRPPTT